MSELFGWIKFIRLGPNEYQALTQIGEDDGKTETAVVGITRAENIERLLEKVADHYRQAFGR